MAVVLALVLVGVASVLAFRRRSRDAEAEQETEEPAELFAGRGFTGLARQVRGTLQAPSEGREEAFTNDEDDPPRGFLALIRRWFVGSKPNLRPKTRPRHPILAGLVIAVVLATTLMGSLDSVLAGMHFEQRDGASVRDLTGGLFGWNSPSDILESIRLWENWWIEAAPERYSSPETISGSYFLIDSAFAVALGVLLLWAIAALHWRLRSKTWRRALALMPWVVVAGVVCDLIENFMLWRVIDSVRFAGDGGTAPATLLLWIAKGKWLLLVVALVLLYFVLVGSIRGRERRWAADLPIYLGGLSVMRVGLITVALTWLVMSGPLIGEQMMDVIRRWDLSHGLIVVLLALFIAAFAGQSTRRVYLRTATATKRYSADPGMSASEAAKKAWIERARRRRMILGWVFVVAFSVGFGVWVSGDTFLRGLFFPGAIGVVVIGMSAPLADEDFVVSGDKRRLVGYLAPRLVAAAIPIIVGLAMFAAIVPEYALGPSATNEWLVLVVLAPIAGAVLLYVAVGHLWSLVIPPRSERREEDETVKGHSQAAASVMLVAVLFLILLGGAYLLNQPVPTLEDGLGAEWLMLIGSSLLALGHTLFYFFVDEPGEVERLSNLEARDHYSPVRSPATLLPKLRPEEGGSRLALIAVLIFILAGIGVWVVSSPIDAAQRLGASAVVLLWVLSLAIVLEVASRVAETSAPPRMIHALGFRRTPFILLGVAWLMFMAILWPTPGFHDEVVMPLRHEGREVVASTRAADLDSLFTRWLDRNGIAMETPGSVDNDEGEPEVVPIVFVSAWGGGIRAGVWTSYVVDCVFSRATVAPTEGRQGAGEALCPDSDDALDAVVSMSGVSGGSLGLVQYIAHLTTSQTTQSDDWVRDRLGGDYLSPATARLFFVDIPLSFLGGAEWIDDRADVLRRAWEKTSEGLDDGLLALWNDHPELPLVIANSTSVNDGCAINISAYDSSPNVQIGDEVIRFGTAGDCTSLLPFLASRGADRYRGALAGMHNLYSFLGADEDISLSTAALMSARFPAISPTGRLRTRSARTGMSNPASLEAVYTTDGGQLELSGALTSVQMWEALEPLVTTFNASRRDYCIVPVAIHIENSFAPERSETADDLPNEWVDPLIWSGTAAKGGLVTNARQRLALEFSESLVAGDQQVRVVRRSKLGAEAKRFAFIRTRAHPGTTAPLGWTLSDSTLTDLQAQLAENDDQFRVVREWFDGSLGCDYVDAD